MPTPPDQGFCLHCGTPLEARHHEDRERPTCPACGFIHYLDPKVACGTVSEIDGKFALIQRNIDPRKGFWSFPCGFMEINETTEQAAQLVCFDAASGAEKWHFVAGGEINSAVAIAAVPA